MNERLKKLTKIKRVIKNDSNQLIESQECGFLILVNFLPLLYGVCVCCVYDCNPDINKSKATDG